MVASSANATSETPEAAMAAMTVPSTEISPSLAYTVSVTALARMAAA